jgi:alpha-1,2-mannosyltransferase
MAAYAIAYFLLMRLPGDIVRSPIAGSDLSSYYTAGSLVRTGQVDHLYDVAPGDTILGDATAGPWREEGDRLGIHRQHYYIYPPFFALLAAPLSLLPFGAARWLWLAVDMALLALFVGLYLAWRRRDGTDPDLAERALIAVTLGLEFLPLIWSLAIGQTTLLILALMAGSILLAKKGKEAGSGLLLGVATAIKLTPGLLILYFAWRGWRRAASWGAATFAACCLAAAVALGPATSVRFFTDVVPRMSEGTPYFLNQSLSGFLNRLLGDGDVRQVALQAPGMVRWIAVPVSILLVAMTAMWFRRRPGRPEGLRLDLELSAVILLTLILSPISWTHHYMLAVIPLYTVVAAASRSGIRSLTLAAAVGIAFLLIARKPHWELFADGPARLALSAAMYGALILWGACLIMLRRPAPLEREASTKEVARAA